MCCFATSPSPGPHPNQVRIWDSRRCVLLRELIGVVIGVLYSISWCRDDDSRLATSSSRGQVLIWNVEDGILQQRVQLGLEVAHPQACPVYAVDWAAEHIVCTTTMGFVAVLRPDGMVMRQINVPGPSYGVCWHAVDPNLFAAACDDCTVRVFELRGTRSPLVKNLVGHTKKVFGVLWSPLVHHMLLSSSDDLTVRVWDTLDNSHKVLSGHTHNVRALHW